MKVEGRRRRERGNAREGKVREVGKKGGEKREEVGEGSWVRRLEEE